MKRSKINKRNGWRCLLGIGLCLGMLLGEVRIYAQDANAILEKAATAYERSNGISATFTMFTSSAAGSSGGESFEGAIQMRGDKFTLVTPDAHTWFNGTTQWTYVERTEEVNVTNPTGEELPFTNPALLISSYQKGFTAAYKGESTAQNGKAAYDVELTPKKKSDIVKVELQIEKYASLPVRITVVAKNGVRTIVHISQLKTGVNQPEDFFVFQEADYPGAEVIDLR